MDLEEMIRRSRENSSLIVDIRSKRFGRGREVLRDVRAELCRGELALILGGSGSGKTTLIKAILGDESAEGNVILSGRQLGRRDMRGAVSVVPQELTLRPSDTLRRTLEDAAAVRLGRRCSAAQRRERIEQVIERVGMSGHADKYISQLSGGQQKKAAVAVQLIGSPDVMICDESDSGLDAASRTQQMQMLCRISRSGRIVLVISHEPDDAVAFTENGRQSLFGKVIVLARSSADMAGHLAFCGSTEGALRFFGVSRLQDIMLEINPISEGGHGRADEFIGRFRAAGGS